MAVFLVGVIRDFENISQSWRDNIIGAVLPNKKIITNSTEVEEMLQGYIKDIESEYGENLSLMQFFNGFHKLMNNAYVPGHIIMDDKVS